MKKFDFVAVGDTVTDAFIKLREAEVTCNKDRTDCRISMKFAEKIPFDGSVIVPAVGNSANAAVAAARLGLKSAIASDIGDDEYGREDLEVFEKEGVGTNFVRINTGKKSNYHFVLLYKGERTILINHESYEYDFPDIGEAAFVYLSSLGENSASYHDQITVHLENHPGTKLAFQPGTFQIKMGFEKLQNIYARSEVVLCNAEEAKKILRLPAKTAQSADRAAEISTLLDGMKKLGPKMAIITDGVRGAYAADAKNKFFVGNYPDPKAPVDRTGAGDAFSSSVVSGLCLGLSLEEALSWGPVNSMSVVQYIGAREGLLTREEITKFLREAPTNYRVQKI